MKCIIEDDRYSVLIIEGNVWLALDNWAESIIKKISVRFSFERKIKLSKKIMIKRVFVVSEKNLYIIFVIRKRNTLNLI